MRKLEFVVLESVKAIGIAVVSMRMFLDNQRETIDHDLSVLKNKQTEISLEYIRQAQQTVFP